VYFITLKILPAVQLPFRGGRNPFSHYVGFALREMRRFTVRSINHMAAADRNFVKVRVARCALVITASDFLATKKILR